MRTAPTRVEIAKQTWRPRTIATIVVVCAVVAAISGLIAAYRQNSPERIGDWGSVIPGSTGVALALVAVNALTLLAFPVIACLYAGDSIAGEASSGSLRYLLAQPVARWRIMSAKIAVSATLTALTIVTSAVLAVLIGLAIYGLHPLPVVDLQHSTAFALSSTTLKSPEALARTLAAVGVILASTATVFAFSFLLSTLTDYSFAAIAGGISLVFVSRALDNIPGLNSLSPWLPVTDPGTTAWTGLFDQPIQPGPITHLLIVQAAYTAVLLTAAFARFVRADIVT